MFIYKSIQCNTIQRLSFNYLNWSTHSRCLPECSLCLGVRSGVFPGVWLGVFLDVCLEVCQGVSPSCSLRLSTDSHPSRDSPLGLPTDNSSPEAKKKHMHDDH